MGQLTIVFLCIVEDADEIIRTGFENLGLGNRQVALRETNPFAQCAAKDVGGTEAWLVAFGDAVHDKLRKSIDLGRVQIIAEHKYVDPTQRSLDFATKRRNEHFFMF